MECVFDFGRRCVALTEKCCEGCRFRKTKEELDEGRKRAKNLINALPEERQNYIRDKYYLGKERKWL